MSGTIRRRRAVGVYANAYVEVFDDEGVFPGGAAGRYLRVHPRGDGPAVVVLPVRAGRIGLVRTYRYPIGAWQWALPRGFAQDADPLATARAELAEELGASASTLRRLGAVTPDSGLLTSRAVVVFAEVERVGPRTDTAEVAAVRWETPARVSEEVRAGVLEDGFTLAALMLAYAAGVLRVRRGRRR
ncbi:MAG: NUDIX hydrolase [Mycobacteriales bacterium]